MDNPKNVTLDIPLVVLGRAIKQIIWDSAARERLEAMGICITPARFYNEIPTMAELRTGYEAREAMPYLMDFMDAAAQSQLLEQLMPFAAEFDPKQDPDGPDDPEFAWNNGLFTRVDAMMYYCMLRRIRPRRVLEIGSGHSTRVAVQALARTGYGDIVAIEPFPSDVLKRLPITLHHGYAQDFDADFFNDQLADGDVLFIDSTHTVKASSDCCHLYLRVLPRLRRKLTIHVHDIVLPRGINIDNAIEKHIYWTEQYLLAALLTDNPKARFLMGAVFANLSDMPVLKRLMGGKAATAGGSFWFAWDGTRAVG